MLTPIAESNQNLRRARPHLSADPLTPVPVDADQRDSQEVIALTAT